MSYLVLVKFIYIRGKIGQMNYEYWKKMTDIGNDNDYGNTRVQ